MACEVVLAAYEPDSSVPRRDSPPWPRFCRLPPWVRPLPTWVRRLRPWSAPSRREFRSIARGSPAAILWRSCMVPLPLPTRIVLFDIYHTKYLQKNSIAPS